MKWQDYTRTSRLEIEDFDHPGFGWSLTADQWAMSVVLKVSRISHGRLYTVDEKIIQSTSIEAEKNGAVEWAQEASKRLSEESAAWAAELNSVVLKRDEGQGDA